MVDKSDAMIGLERKEYAASSLQAKRFNAAFKHDHPHPLTGGGIS